MEFSLAEYVKRSRHEVTPAEERARKRYYERSRWDRSASYQPIPMYDYTPSGILTIQVGRWPSRTWKDTPKTLLEKRLGEVISGVLVLTQETHAKELEEARKQEARRCAIANYEYLTKRRAEESERLKGLEAKAIQWERATKLRAYVNAVEEEAKRNGGVDNELADWLAWARAKADGLDPLTQISDPILGAPEPKRPSYW